MQDAGKSLENLILNRLVEAKFITPGLAVSKKLRENVLKLSDAFTRERADLPPNYFDDETNRLAYLAGFVLTNAAKVTSCLEQLQEILPKEGPLRILDVGTGPGTAVFAASSFFSDREINFVALEKNSRILDEARSLGRLLPKKHVVEWVVGGLENLPDKQFDVAMAANVLNELKLTEQLRTCKKLLFTSKVLVIIDPALKQTTRDLMALRDQLIDSVRASTVAPCTHQSPCPMLAANQRDWCHFYLEWRRPKLIEALDSATGLDHCYLKMAYLSLRAKRSNLDLNNEIAASPTAPRNDIYRVVSSPLKSKGKLELIVCGNGELKRLRRLDKNASKSNDAFGAAKRGDLIEFTEKERPGEIRARDSFRILYASVTQP